MVTDFAWRRPLSVGVLVASAGAAYWLAREDATIAEAPAQAVAQEYRVAVTETGRIKEIVVAAGERVRAGQVLARLDTAVLEREIAVAEARLRQLGAEIPASAAAMETDGYQAERSFQADLDEATAQWEAGKTAAAQEAADLKNLREEIGRQQGFVREGLARRDRVDELEVRARSLEEAVAQWPERLAGLEERKKAAGERLRKWREEHKASTAPESREARLQPLRKRFAEQREALRVLMERLAEATVTAPADAEVVAVMARPGDVARPGEPFLLLNGTGPRMVVAYVDENAGARLQVGTAAVVKRRTPRREQAASRVVRVADAVTQLPQRFWTLPSLAQWGREVYLEWPAGVQLDGGEALDVRFLAGEARAAGVESERGGGVKKVLAGEWR